MLPAYNVSTALEHSPAEWDKLAAELTQAELSLALHTQSPGVADAVPDHAMGELETAASGALLDARCLLALELVNGSSSAADAAINTRKRPIDQGDSCSDSSEEWEDAMRQVGGVCMCGLGCRRLLLADEVNFCSTCSRDHEGSWQCKCDACGQCRCCCTCDSTVSHRRHCPGHRTGLELCLECDDDDDDDTESSDVVDYSLAREDSA